MANRSNNNTNLTGDDEYTVVPIIPIDFAFHTDEHPECFDPDCDCQAQKIADLTQAVNDGLATPNDATRIIQGKTI